jgi:hypothetical protein
MPDLVLPYHDPEAIVYPHMMSIRDELASRFGRAFISISPRTQQDQPAMIEALTRDRFFVVNFNDPASVLGDHYVSAMRSALHHCAPESVLHICDIDRVAYVLHTDHREEYLADLQIAASTRTPLLFQRSERAWQTYPANYREIESWAIRAGQMIFGRYLDFAWSYFVIPARDLAAVLPRLHHRDFKILVQMVLLTLPTLQTKDVDWLAWEDPYILGMDADDLRQRRETDPQETHKRLRGLTPIMQPLIEYISEGEFAWDRPLRRVFTRQS